MRTPAVRAAPSATRRGWRVVNKLMIYILFCRSDGLVVRVLVVSVGRTQQLYVRRRRILVPEGTTPNEHDLFVSAASPIWRDMGEQERLRGPRQLTSAERWRSVAQGRNAVVETLLGAIYVTLAGAALHLTRLRLRPASCRE
jgi:hypothetical protein